MKNFEMEKKILKDLLPVKNDRIIKNVESDKGLQKALLKFAIREDTYNDGKKMFRAQLKKEQPDSDTPATRDDILKALMFANKHLGKVERYSTYLKKSLRKMWPNIEELEKRRNDRGLNSTDQATYDSYSEYLKATNKIIEDMHNNVASKDEIAIAKASCLISRGNEGMALMLKQHLSNSVDRRLNGNEINFKFLNEDIRNGIRHYNALKERVKEDELRDIRGNR